MTSSIPDAISTDELLRIQVNAEPDFVPADPSVEKPLYDGLTQTEVEELAMETLRGMSKKCKDPMVEKCILLAVAASWIRWHTEMAQSVMPDTAESLRSEAATEFATCLLRDAGKAQAIYTLVHDISMDNDFITGDNINSDSE
jgi:hypothetical protein